MEGQAEDNGQQSAVSDRPSAAGPAPEGPSSDSTIHNPQSAIQDDDIAVSVRELSKLYRVRSGPEPQWVSLLAPRYISPANRLDQWALRDVSFDLSRGRKLALVGSNGAGKSTLLKLLARLINPTSGQIAVRGSVLPLLELGAGFHPDLSGYENVFLQGSILGLSREEIRGRLGEIVAFSELEDFMETPVKYYSSGMFARLAFSVAVHCNPDVLLVDEILSVGDPEFQAKSFNKMMEFVDEGRTLLLVSHNVYALRQICDEAIWLDEGRVREVGPAYDVVWNYMRWNFDRAEALEANKRKDLALRREPSPELPKCRIVGLRLFDKEGRPCERVVSQEPLRVEIECEADGEIGDVGCRVLLRSKGDTAIVQADSLEQGAAFVLPEGKSTIRVAIDSLIAKQAPHGFEIEAILFHHQPQGPAARLASLQQPLDLVNSDGQPAEYYFHSDWRFEAEGKQ